MSFIKFEDKHSEELNSVLWRDYVEFKYTEEKWKNFKPSVTIPIYKKLGEAKKNMKVYEDDVFVCTFPRSGTTLTQEMVWLIQNNCDFESTKSQVLDHRCPELEFAEVVQRIYTGEYTDIIPNIKRPRTFKTHLPIHSLPDQVWEVKPKLIHVTRDVKDVAVSYFHLYRDLYHSQVEKEQFFEAFLEDRVVSAPYREHRLDYLNVKGYDNILFLTYEEMIENIEEAIKKVSKFLDKTISDENLQKLKEHLKFDSMKKNKSCNNQAFFDLVNLKTKETSHPTDCFIRKGVVGSHASEMSPEFVDRFDNWMNEKIPSGWDA